MQSLQITRPQADSPASGWGSVVRPWIGNRWVLVGAGLAVVGSGLALGWDWLTAVGAAPLILSAAPCLVMCAVGACAMCRSNPGRSALPPPASEK